MFNKYVGPTEDSAAPSIENTYVSVALCTYNGARFLKEQLESIQRQQRLPDELVICDDCSTDHSQSIIQQFAKDSSFPVRWYFNEQNIRSTKNFEKAISLCRGELIVLSDQDDVWESSKLSILVDVLRSNPAAGFVFSDALLTDDSLQPLRYSLWDAVGFDSRAGAMAVRNGLFPYLLSRFCVTGATMAFRSKYRDLVLPIPSTWVHDAWIALLIAAVDDGCFVPMQLIRYRQHSTQQIGERKRSLYQQFQVARRMSTSSFQRVVDDFTLALERLEKSGQVSDVRLQLLRDKIDHFKTRCKIRTTARFRFAAVLREWLSGRYGKYSLGWKSVAQDLFIG